MSYPPENFEKILVVLYGPLARLLAATGTLKAIRTLHPKAEITLLTSPRGEEFAETCPYIDQVWLDEMAKWWVVPGWWEVFKQVREYGFDRGYDLQHSLRSEWLFRFMGKKRKEWSGPMEWCSHSFYNPTALLDRLPVTYAMQMKSAGWEGDVLPDVDWLQGDVLEIADITTKMVLIVPGDAQDNRAKMWPMSYYAEVTEVLIDNGFTPVFLGDDFHYRWVVAPIIDQLEEEDRPKALNLAGKLSLGDVASLARRAQLTLGGDTGLVHLAALVGCQTLMLYSGLSHPEITSPDVENALVLRRHELKNLPVDTVLEGMEKIITGEIWALQSEEDAD